MLQWFITNGNGVSAICAAIACLVAAWALLTQRSHNRLSVRPLPEITYSDLEDKIEIRLVNHGTGPLVVNRLAVSRSGRVVGDSLIKQMPHHLTDYEWFVDAIDGRSIPVGGRIVLLRYRPIPRWHGSDIPEIRKALKDLKIHLLYSDVYKVEFPAYVRALDWFGRHGKAPNRSS